MKVKLKKNEKLVVSRGFFRLRSSHTIYYDLIRFLRENDKVEKWIKVSLKPFEGCVKIERVIDYPYSNTTYYTINNSYFGICSRKLTRYFKCIPEQIYVKL